MRRLAGIVCLVVTVAAAKPRVATLEFRNNGNAGLAALSAAIPDMLMTSLASDGRMTVVERSQIDRITAEMALGASGVVEPSTAAEIGKVVGADLVIIGSFVELGHKLRIDARVVKVETATVVPGTTHSVQAVTMEGVDGAVDKLAAALSDKLAGGSGARSLGDPSAKGRIHFSVTSCNTCGIRIDGAVAKSDDNLVSHTTVGHGNRMIELFKGVFKPTILAEKKVFVPGGYVVRMRQSGDSLQVYETAPLSGGASDAAKTPVAAGGGEVAQTDQVILSVPGMTAGYSVEMKSTTRRQSSGSAGTGTTATTAPAVKRLGYNELLQLLQAMEKEDFEDTRMAMMRSALKNKALEVDQTVELMKRFSFDDDRVDAAKFCYPKLVDKDNLFRVYAVLEFDASKEELQEWVDEQ